MPAKISVIIPFYNVEKFAKRCIESVLTQTFTDFELILVDDGSPDDCGKICDEFAKKDERVRVFHTENHGLSAARNLGLENATGEYINFIDGDDAVAPDYLEYLYKLINKNRADVAVCGPLSFFYVPSTGEFRRNAVPEKLGDFTVSSEKALKLMLTDQYELTVAMAKLYRRELFDDIRYPIGQLFEDANTTYKIYLKSKKITIGKERKYLYTVRQDSISHANFVPGDLDLLKASDTIGAEIVAKYPKLKSAVATNRARSRILVLNKMINGGAGGAQARQIVNELSELMGDLDESCEQSKRLKNVVDFVVSKPGVYMKLMRGFNATIMPR